MMKLEEFLNKEYIQKDKDFQQKYINLTKTLNDEFIKQMKTNMTRDYLANMINTFGVTTEIEKTILLQYTPTFLVDIDDINHIVKIRPTDNSNNYTVYAGYVYDTNKINPFVNLTLNQQALVIPYSPNLSREDVLQEMAASPILGLPCNFWNNDIIIRTLEEIFEEAHIIIKSGSEKNFIDKKYLFQLTIIKQKSR